MGLHKRFLSLVILAALSATSQADWRYVYLPTNNTHNAISDTYRAGGAPTSLAMQFSPDSPEPCRQPILSIIAINLDLDDATPQTTSSNVDINLLTENAKLGTWPKAELTVKDQHDGMYTMMLRIILSPEDVYAIAKSKLLRVQILGGELMTVDLTGSSKAITSAMRSCAVEVPPQPQKFSEKILTF